MRSFHFLRSGVALSAVLLMTVVVVAKTNQEDANDSWSANGILFSPNRVASNCDIYLAPSKLGGWGVFAGRNFEPNEVIEVAPRFLPVTSTALQETVLYDYHYSFRWELDKENDSFGMIALGMILWYQHGEDQLHNVAILSFGREPDGHNPGLAMGLGYAALRHIERGEELFTTYGGEHWFTARGLSMITPELVKPSVEEMNRREDMYCSRSIAGVGHSTWARLSIFAETIPNVRIDPDQLLPLQDHPTAKAKVAYEKNQIIEYAPALVLPLEYVKNSFLEPLCIKWTDWDTTQQKSIQTLRTQGSFRLKGYDHEKGAYVPDVLDEIENAVIFPAAGNIGMLRKVGPSNNPNCRIEVVSDQQDDVGSAGLVLKVIATKNIPQGEELRLNLPESSSWFSKNSLLQELALTGQAVPKFLADPYNHDVDTLLQNYNGGNDEL